MKQQLLLAASFALAAFLVLPSAQSSQTKTQYFVQRSPGLTQFLAIENDTYLAAVNAEVSTLVEADTEMTVGKLATLLAATHQSVQVTTDKDIEYFYRVLPNGQVERICLQVSVITVQDSQLTPVRVRVEETVEV